LRVLLLIVSQDKAYREIVAQEEHPVVSYRTLLAERLHAQQRTSLFCTVERELGHLRSGLGFRRATFLVDTEFLLANIVESLLKTDRVESLALFFRGLHGLAHSADPIIFCCLPTVDFDRTTWQRGHRLITNGGDGTHGQTC
jgi:hypothetical protein